MGYANYVGRVGALAVALGIGAAVASTAGMAWAQDGDDPASQSQDSTPPGETPGDPAPDAPGENPGGGGGDPGPADPPSQPVVETQPKKPERRA